MIRLGLIIQGVAMPVTPAMHIHAIMRMTNKTANQNQRSSKNEA